MAGIRNRGSRVFFFLPEVREKKFGGPDYRSSVVLSRRSSISLLRYKALKELIDQLLPAKSMFPIPPPVRHREPQKEAQQDRQGIRSGEHLTLMLCGASGSGKSTTAGRLLFELGELDERQMDCLRQESAAMGKPTMAYAFHTDTLKTERERGKSISCTFREFHTDKYELNLVAGPSFLDFCWRTIITPPHTPGGTTHWSILPAIVISSRT